MPEIKKVTAGMWSDKIARALAEMADVFPQKAIVACQGVEGAYSGLAAEKLFQEPHIKYYKSFEDVFMAVENGECRYGVLPIENSTAGSVLKVYELMDKHQFSIVRALKLKIDHNLLVKKGVDLSEVREIFSHEQAIGQCEAFLQSLGDIKISACANTAMAAKMVSESERRDIAALSSAVCAEKYDLDILLSAVQDQVNNYTRFICISKDTEIYPQADKMSVMMILKHQPGALYQVLAKFAELDINLTKIESRPIADREFEFRFFLDLDCPLYTDEVARLLNELQIQHEVCSFLGLYTEVK